MATGFWRTAGEATGFLTPTEYRDDAATAPTATDATTVTSPTTSTGIIPPARPAVGFSVEAALSLATVYRCISIIVGAIAQMPLQTLRSGRVVSSPDWITQPNLDTTQTDLVSETVFSLAAHGNAYWLIDRHGTAETPRAIQVLPPEAVSIREHRDDRTGLITRRTYSIGHRELKPWEIRHLRLIRRPGHTLGAGPLQTASSEILAALRLREYVNTWFDTSGVPSGVLKTDQQLNRNQATEIASRWTDFIRRFGFGVLSNGMSYESLLLDPEKAQYTSVQQQVVVTIARLFGVPARHLLAQVEGSSMTYSNLETENVAFLVNTLARYMTEIEAALTALIPGASEVQFHESTLLRLDARTKATVEASQITSGTRTPDELRALDNLPPLTDPAPASPTPTTSKETA